MNKIFATLTFALAPSLVACVDEVNLGNEPVAPSSSASVEGECGPQPTKLYRFEEWNREAFPSEVRRAALVVEHYDEPNEKGEQRITIYGIDTDKRELVFALDAPEKAEAKALHEVIRGGLASAEGEALIREKDRANHVIVVMTSTPSPPPPRPSGTDWLVRSWDIIDVAGLHAQIDLPIDAVCPAF